MSHIEGKTIVVTGAANGFGKLVAEKATALGAKVVAGDVNEHALAELGETIERARGRLRRA